MHTASLIALGCVLFLLTSVVLGLSRLMLRSSTKV
jgi:ABC-type phosphate transport system permease subunit